MPFIALDPDGERVCTLDQTGDLRLKYPGGSFRCQLCEGEMIYRNTVKARPHFAHKPNAPCSSDYEHKSESSEHLEAKARIRDHLKTKYGPGAHVDLEYRLPAVGRVADVMVTFNGFMEAHEIQFSPVTAAELEERTNDYESQGISVFWWFGPKCSGPQRQWSFDRFGEYHTVQVSNAA